MDLRQFQYILKVAQLGNITRAAEELYITQPALSHYISKVEKEEGVKLFDRSTTPISLTYAGEKYIETIRQILELSDQLKEEIEEISACRKGILKIGIPPARAAYMLPPFFSAFKEKFPLVEVDTVEHNSRQLRQDVLQGNVDFAILPELKRSDEFRYIELFMEEIFVVCKQGILSEDQYFRNSQGEKVIRIDRLKDNGFILLKNGHGIRDALDIIFSMNGFKPRLVMETTNNSVAFCMSAAGLGLAIVPAPTILTMNSTEPMDVFKLSESGYKWKISAMVNKDNHLSKIVSDSLSMMKELYGEGVHSLE